MGEREDRSLEQASAARMSPDVRLMAFILPPFHLVVLTLILVMVAYASGSLGQQLESIGTLSGIVLYVVLWLSTTWTTRRAIGQALSQSADPRGVPSPTMVAMKWGGINGILFFVALLVMYLAAAIQTMFGSSESALVTSPSIRQFALGLFGILPYIAIAAIVAFGVGAAIGFVLSLLDRGAIRLGGRIAAWSMSTSEPESEPDAL